MQKTAQPEAAFSLPQIHSRTPLLTQAFGAFFLLSGSPDSECKKRHSRGSKASLYCNSVPGTELNLDGTFEKNETIHF